jgi:hypothetical protein
MNPEEIKTIESQQRELLTQLSVAETALRFALHKHGFGNTPRAHMERAIAHIHEAHIAINESKAVRSVHQLADDLTRIEKVMDNARQGRSQHI